MHWKMSVMRDKSITSGQKQKFMMIFWLPKSEKFSFLGNKAPDIVKND